MVGYLAKRRGVTSFTRLSVHCADRMVATSSSHASRWRSGTFGLGYMSSSSLIVLATRAARSPAVLGRGTNLGGVAFFVTLIFFVTLGLSLLAKISCYASPLSSHLADACGARFILTTIRCWQASSGVRSRYGLSLTSHSGSTIGWVTEIRRAIMRSTWPCI